MLRNKHNTSFKFFFGQNPKIVFILGIAFSILTTSVVERKIEQKQNEYLSHVAEKITEDIQLSLNQYYHALEGTVGILHAFKFEPKPEIYKVYAEARHNFESFKGALGVGYIKKINKNSLNQFLSKMQLDRPHFHLKRLGDESNQLRLQENLFIIENIEPRAANEKAIGLVISDESNRLEAALKAMTSGQPNLTRTIQLVQAQKSEPGFLFYVPVYSTFQTPPTQEERIQKLIGLAYSPILASELFTFALQQRAETLQFEVYELNEQNEAHQLIYSSAPKGKRVKFGHLWDKTIFMAGQNWLIKVDIAPYSNINYENYWSFVIFTIGFLLSYLFYTILKKYQDESDVKNNVIKNAQNDVKSAYTELKKNSDFLHKTINSIPAMIGYWDKDLKNRLSNNIYTKYFGKMPSEIYGLHIKDLLTQEVYQRNIPHIEKALNGEPQLFERTLIQPNGECRHVLAKYIPDIIANEVHGFFAVVIDITDIKNLEKQNRDVQAQLYSKAKLSKLGEMASGIAHEVNNPLTIISVKSQKIKNQLDKIIIPIETKEQVYRCINDINATVDRIAAIVKGLRNFSRDSDEDPYTDTSLSKIINEVTDLCRERIAKKNIILKTECAENIKVFCNSVQISQVLMNLISNSIDAIENAKTKWIEITAISISEEHLEIEITDSGSGISSEIEDKIMEPFFTTKDIGKGTGLGLSISKGIIEMHNGKLQYYLKNENTCFRIILPFKQLSSNRLAS